MTGEIGLLDDVLTEDICVLAVHLAINAIIPPDSGLVSGIVFGCLH